MKCINTAMNNQLTSKIWLSMIKVESNLGKRSAARWHLEEHLHNRLEGRIKFGVMIPIEWRLNTLLER
jgi:hypothetical protein